jgi:hypothetical protein
MRLVLLALCCLWLTSGPAHASTPACTTVANGANQDITVGGVCRNIANTTGRSICALTGNTAIWNSYISRTAAGVTVSACGSPPPPAAPGDTCSGGTCWGGKRCCGSDGIYDAGMVCRCSDACVDPFSGICP